MKRTRKGFTLLELLVVIGVMGIMSSLAMVGGQQATDAARATNIADGLEKAASAMMMYYADNADEINKSGTTAADVIKGANAYLKTTLVDTAETDKAGRYSVELSAANDPKAKWYVTYTFLDTDGSLKAILANKATRMQLKDKAADVPAVEANEDEGIDAQDAQPVAAYDGSTNVVYMLVR